MFRKVLALTPEQRQSYLEEACGEDAERRHEIESLVRADSEAGDFLAYPLACAGWLGPYRILDELGRGGMGAVYLACREDGDGEKVAVKVVRHGLPQYAWHRLRTEYRILAELDHPGIARVLDAGTTADGRPYFVMEYVEGMQIESYCTQHELSTKARLELILKVCDAVEAAHSQGVVHRDLKPSNILVTPDGDPVLLDFGIAKLLDPESRPYPVEATRTYEQPLTPQYASPEQLSGEEITPSSDVYSLGVVLYQLLTGRLPYSLRRYSTRALERAFEEQLPLRPSSVAEDLSHSEELIRLDAVVLKALRLNVDERYETVRRLARDLRGSLEARPRQSEPEVEGPENGGSEPGSLAVVTPGGLRIEGLVWPQVLELARIYR